MSKAVTLCMKMDINLQFKKYDIAKDAAKKLIDSGLFELYYAPNGENNPGANYRGLFSYSGGRDKDY